jgi:ABC-type multidrug transport system fused ATPase/permease subunit
MASDFLRLTLFLFEIFIFVAYIMVMFHVMVDLFRDTDLGGSAKVLWIIALLFLPIVTALIYLLARGKGMAERQRAALVRVRSQQEEYIREVAGASPADQIARAKALLTEGAITQDEYARLKAKALS